MSLANFLISENQILIRASLSPGPSHIVPVLVGDPMLAKIASDTLLTDHGIYVQAINYPTVARGEERLRFTVTPRHTAEQMDHLVSAVDQVFTQLNIKRIQDWKAKGGRAGVGMVDPETIAPIWTDEQLGLLDGTAPKTLKNGEKGVVDAKAVDFTREKFANLLGPVATSGFKTRGSFKGQVGLGYPPVDAFEQIPIPIAAAA